MKKTTQRILCSFLAVIMSLTLSMPAFADSQSNGAGQTLSSLGDVATSAAKPTISTTLQDGITLKGSIKNFDIIADNADGTKISASNITVKLNGNPVNVTFDDSVKTSYRLKLAVGSNTVEITATGSNGATTTVTYTLNHTAVNDGDVIGKATFCIEAFTISNGYIVEPVQVDIHEGERASQVLDRVLTQNGLTYRSTGSLTSGFYLSKVKDGSRKLGISNPTPPAILQSHLNHFNVKSTYDGSSLGEFDFTPLSGWMYCVNGNFPNYGFADCYLTDGDVVRVQFTLAFGNDIGGGSALGSGGTSNYYDIANKDSLTSLVAQVNSSSDKAGLLGDSAVKSAYDAAVSTLENLSPGQSVVDSAYSALNSAIIAYSTPVNQTGFAFTDSSVTKTYGDVPFIVSATGGQGSGGITYSCSNDAVTVDSITGKVTINKVGTAVITAIKGGDNRHNAAIAQITVTVKPAEQTGFAFSDKSITKTYGDEAFTVSATGGQSLGGTTYSCSNDVISIDGNTGKVAINKAGTAVITATKAADGNYNAAIAQTTVTVNPANQSGFAFTDTSIEKTYGDAPFAVSAAGGQSKGAVTYTSSNDVVTVDGSTGKVTVNKADTAVITAIKATDGNYKETSATITINVKKAVATVKKAPAATAITVIGKLSSSKLSGGIGNVSGNFTWTNPNTLVSKTGKYDVTFTPDDTDNYTPCTFKIKVRVNQIYTSKSGVAVDLTRLKLSGNVTSISLANSTVKKTSKVYSGISKLIKSKFNGFKIFKLSLLNQIGKAIKNSSGKITVKVPVSSRLKNGHVYFYDGRSGKITNMHAKRQKKYLVFKTASFGYFAVTD